ncbi:site-specific integrase [Undibacterium sp. FT79W]|uniref:site-specific integrase n=1 Tax=Undibacterium sp. FT79W TaxID=2762296 RepID=UPI00164A35AF|nr:site-specific integrase [Undibacterium sp. FT79W]MBC3879349.1 site-specific integrase [Undibacterium sp. FT79W]
MASIKQSSTGIYQVRVRSNKYPTVCKSFHSLKDAKSWAKWIEAEQQSGRWLTVAHIKIPTLKEALIKYSQEVTPLKKSAKREIYTIGAICRANITSKQLDLIKGADIASLRDQWLKEALSPATVRLRMATISHCYTIAFKEWGLNITNPVLQVRKPLVSNARERRLYKGEFEAVLNAAEFKGLKEVALLALASAMRLSEVVALRWTDISITNKTATLHNTKNGKPRIVPLGAEALSIIEALPNCSNGRLFDSESHAMSQAWARAVKRARAIYEADCVSNSITPDDRYLIDLRFHDLRHERISRLFELGILNTMEVAAISGHRTIQMLARYTHLNASRIADKLVAA